jgi:glyoxylase-like metal-dependent hydrolase (beta-lactamase superfamily II)
LNFVERLNNIYVLDTQMHGFAHYNSAYIVEGKEIALIDTGTAKQIEALRAGIKAHGFSISDISYIFLTHCEHSDHSGGVGILLKENTRAKVYINAVGEDYITDPSILIQKLANQYPPELQAHVLDNKTMVPVPRSRIQHLQDGEVFDLGNGEKLKIIFAPGHQPSGIVLAEEKNRGLFINDLVGNCFIDADAHYPLNPGECDNLQILEALKKLINLPVDYLYLGHYGICQNPQKIMEQAIANIQILLNIGIKCMREGKPENIAGEAYHFILPELEKLRLARGEKIYHYAIREHIPTQMKTFTAYCQKRFNKNSPLLKRS